LAFVMTGDREASEDIVQEAFLATRRRWDGVRDVKPYLRAAVVNGSRSWLRRKKLERSQPAVSELGYVGSPDELWDALGRLKPRSRVAVVLRYYEGLPDAEIAELLGCREGTVRTTIHRALAALRKEIER
jgi:DNA-directed RNA polymerase specialized sigma24 family protein